MRASAEKKEATNMDILKFKVPQGSINQASQAIQALKSKYDALNARDKEAREKLDTNGGVSAINAMHATLDEIKAEKAQARYTAMRIVKEARDLYFANIDQQAALDGSQLGTDHTLLAGGLVRTERELQALADKHIQNPAMRHAIAQYAEARHWSNFEDYTTEQALRDYGENLFDHAAKGVENPYSYGGELLSNPDALIRTQRSNHLID